MLRAEIVLPANNHPATPFLALSAYPLSTLGVRWGGLGVREGVREGGREGLLRVGDGGMREAEVIGGGPLRQCFVNTVSRIAYQAVIFLSTLSVLKVTRSSLQTVHVTCSFRESDRRYADSVTRCRPLFSHSLP